MEDRELENPRLLELETWKELIIGPEWKVFLQLLEHHKRYLEAQVVIKVASKKFDDAVCFEARAREVEALKGLVSDRINSLKGGKANG